MNETEPNVISIPQEAASRGVEVMLWRAALALGMNEAHADGALASVLRHTARPQGASESRLLRIVIDSVASVSGVGLPRGAAFRRLVDAGGVPADVAAHALDLDESQARNSAGAGDETNLADLRDRVRRADVGAALVRVDAMTVGLRRRRLAVNVLKYGVFFFVLGLVVYVMFDLREAARREKAKQTPGDVYSLPMPKTGK